MIEFEVPEKVEEHFLHFTSYEYPKGILVVLKISWESCRPNAAKTTTNKHTKAYC